MALTTITVDPAVKDCLGSDKPEEVSGSEYLADLYEVTDIHNVVGEVSYDGVETACGAALRDEFAAEVLQ